MSRLSIRQIGRFLVAFGCLWLSACGSKLTLDQYQKLKAGMSEAEVVELLGKPTDATEMMSMRMLVWKRGSNAISVTFVNDKLTAQAGSFDDGRVKVSATHATSMNPAEILGVKVNSPPPVTTPPPASPPREAPPEAPAEKPSTVKSPLVSSASPSPSQPPARPAAPGASPPAAAKPAPPSTRPGTLPSSPPAPLPVPTSDLFARARAVLNERSAVEGRTIGWSNGDRYRDVPAEPAILRGLEVTVGEHFNKPIITSVRPLYLVDNGMMAGSVHGVQGNRVYRLEAVPGYAVGGITARAGLGIDGLRVTFMAIKGDALDPTKSYQSDWVGGTTGGSQVQIGGDGTPAVGIVGFTQHQGQAPGRASQNGGASLGGGRRAAPNPSPRPAPTDRRVFIGLGLVTMPTDH